MKIIKTALHYWFAIISVLSFLVGWGMLAHSLKPVQPTQVTNVNTTSLPALPPIQAFGGASGNGNGLNFSAPSSQSNSNNGFPILRSGGS
jgi:hypothetical protein